MRKFKTVTAILLILGGYGSLTARDLSLQEALKLAAKHSFSLKKVKAQSEASRTELSAATAERFPTLSLGAGSYYISEVPTFTIELPTGNSFTRDFGTSETYQADIRLSLPLFTGGKITGGIDLAKAGVASSRALERMETDYLHYLTRLKYFNLYRANLLAAIARTSLKRTGIILDDINSLFEAGAADSVDLLDARLALTRADYAVTQAETFRKTAEIELSTLLGLNLPDSLALTTQLKEPEPLAKMEEFHEDKAELMLSRANISLYQSRLKLARADYFPMLSVYTGYSYGKPNLDRFNNTWNDYYTIGANLSWSFNIGGKHINKVRAAHYNLSSARHEYDRVLENLNQQLAVAREYVKNAYEKYLSAREENRITENNYRLATERHRQGVLATNRLLEIETTLTASQSSLAATLVDYHIALSNYYYISGSTRLSEGN